MASALLRLLPRGTKVTGEVLLDGENVLDMRPGRLRAVRWTELAIVFQGALHTLNPVQRVGDQIGEAIRLHSRNGGEPREARGRAARAGGAAGAARVGVSAPALGRPAPARADRARGRVRAADADRRRAHHRARRDGAGAGAAPAGGPPARPRPRDHLHHARPLDAREHLPADRGDVRGADRGGGAERQGVRRRRAPVHARARRRVPRDRRPARSG